MAATNVLHYLDQGLALRIDTYSAPEYPTMREAGTADDVRSVNAVGSGTWP
jgi:hypothetical protein